MEVSECSAGQVEGSKRVEVIREHMELVYILQNKEEKGIVYFSDRLYSQQFCF